MTFAFDISHTAVTVIFKQQYEKNLIYFICFWHKITVN